MRDRQFLQTIRASLKEYELQRGGPSESVSRIILAVDRELQIKCLPKWVRLFPLGWVVINGAVIFSDKASLRPLVVDFRTRGVDLVIDYEPQSLEERRGPAAAWIKDLEARDDGLWAKVDWTEWGQDFLERKGYQYFSPIVKFDPGTRKPYALIRVGLTEVPVVRGFPGYFIFNSCGHEARNQIFQGD